MQNAVTLAGRPTTNVRTRSIYFISAFPRRNPRRRGSAISKDRLIHPGLAETHLETQSFTHLRNFHRLPSRIRLVICIAAPHLRAKRSEYRLSHIRYRPSSWFLRGERRIWVDRLGGLWVNLSLPSDSQRSKQPSERRERRCWVAVANDSGLWVSGGLAVGIKY